LNLKILKINRILDLGLDFGYFLGLDLGFFGFMDFIWFLGFPSKSNLKTQFFWVRTSDFELYQLKYPVVNLKA
jgi:hypothetical protein